MPNYKAMYFHLLGKLSDVMELLQQAVAEGEEAYLEDPGANIKLISTEEPVE